MLRCFLARAPARAQRIFGQFWTENVLSSGVSTRVYFAGDRGPRPQRLVIWRLGCCLRRSPSTDPPPTRSEVVDRQFPNVLINFQCERRDAVGGRAGRKTSPDSPRSLRTLSHFTLLAYPDLHKFLIIRERAGEGNRTRVDVPYTDKV
jgi:hypothetical protein